MHKIPIIICRLRKGNIFQRLVRQKIKASNLKKWMCQQAAGWPKEYWFQGYGCFLSTYLF